MVQITISNESYLGANDGRINITPQFGIPPYTYLWSNGNTFKDITNLSAGTYECVITDSNDNQYSLNATVENGDPLLIVTLDINDAQCPNGKGSILVNTTGGNGTYEYEWSNETGIIGGSFDDSFNNSFTHVLSNANVLPQGYYSVTVTSGTQSETLQFYIDAPPNYIFTYEILVEAENPLDTATIRYQVFNAYETFFVPYDENGNQLFLPEIAVTGDANLYSEGTIELPVGTYYYAGEWTPRIDLPSDICTANFIIEVTTNYNCSDFRIDDFQLFPLEQRLTATLLGEVGNTEYRINMGEWLVFTGEVNNLPFGKNIIYFKNKAGCIIQREIKSYSIFTNELTDSFTMSYSANTQRWTSFHSYTPDSLVQIGEDLHSLNNNILEEHNVGAVGKFYNIIHRSVVDLVFTAPEHVIWSFFYWNTIVNQSNGVYIYDETIDSVTVRNLYQTSGQIELEKFYNITRYQEEYNLTSILKNYWHFNSFRDRANVNQSIIRNLYQNYDTIESNLLPNDIPEHRLHRMTSPYVILRLEESNQRGYEFQLNGVNAVISKIYR